MRSDAVDFLMGQKNGANYVVLYQMLCLMTINTNGRLSRQIGEVIIPYDVDKIQRDTKWFSTDTVRVALGLYAKLGLIYQEKDGTLVLANHSEMVGSETDYAAQKKLQRTNQRQIEAEHCGQCPQDVHADVPKNVHTDIRDKILDIDKSSSSKDDSSYIGTRTTKYLVDFFRDNVGKLSKTGEKELTGYIERMDADLVYAVIDKCADLGGSSWAYVRTRGKRGTWAASSQHQFSLRSPKASSGSCMWRPTGLTRFRDLSSRKRAAPSLVSFLPADINSNKGI